MTLEELQVILTVNIAQVLPQVMEARKAFGTLTGAADEAGTGMDKAMSKSSSGTEKSLDSQNRAEEKSVQATQKAVRAKAQSLEEITAIANRAADRYTQSISGMSEAEASAQTYAAIRPSRMASDNQQPVTAQSAQPVSDTSHMDKIRETAQRMRKSLSDMFSGASAGASESQHAFDTMAAKLDNINARAYVLQKRLDSMRASYSKVAEQSGSESPGALKLQGQILSAENRLAALTAQSDKTAAALEDLRTSETETGNAAQQLGRKTEEAGERTRAATSSSSGFERALNRIQGQIFRNLIVYGLLIKGLSSLGSYMWNALKTDTAFSDSLNNLKVQLLTAFYPIYQAALPALTSLINALARAMTNPALQPGDIVEQVDRNGVHYRTIVTGSDFAYRSKCQLQAKGASELNQGYQSQMTKKVSQLVRSIHQKQVQLDSLDQAIVSATSMIAGALGGYFVNGDTLPDEKYHGNIFICDSVGDDPAHPDVTKATKVWRWNLGGFGYSSTGIAGPYTTAITADGSIVASLITAGIVTADIIKAGILQAKDGSSFLDLDTGAFSFGDGSLKWDSVNGFNCISAKEITTNNSNVKGIIGKTSSGLDGLILSYKDKVFAEILPEDSEWGTPGGESGNLVGGTLHILCGSGDVLTDSDSGIAINYSKDSDSGLTSCSINALKDVSNFTISSENANIKIFSNQNINGSKGTASFDTSGVHLGNGASGEIPIPAGGGYSAFNIHTKDGVITGWGA